MVQSYYIKTFGCQMNVADSREYRLVLEACGLKPASDAFDADILLVNTCSVREKAEDKLVSYLGEAQAALTENPELKIGLLGCTATLIGEKLMKRFPAIKLQVPATKIDSFRELLLDAFPELAVDSPEMSHIVPEREKVERFVTIMRGCESFCTYCVVPDARGAVRSLPYREILNRCKQAISEGTRIIVLLGQNVMAYGRNPDVAGGSPENFNRLLAKISSEFPDIWIKFLTSHPRDVDPELIDLIASRKNISRHFHLPIQSGDDRVLKDMNRGYTSGEYRQLIERIRSVLPESRISTDIITGFPTEDDDAFRNSIELTRELEFDQMFTFQYSPRPGTAAVKWKDPVPFEEKRGRLQRLIELQNSIVLKKHLSRVGQTMDVIVYTDSANGNNRPSAVSRESDIVLLPGADVSAGEKVRVEITKGLQRVLEGKKI